MELKVNDKFESYIENIENNLKNKKNLMLYRDFSLDEKIILARFMYSSEKNKLEFICLDIFYNIYKCNLTEFTLGEISIIKDLNDNVNGEAVEYKCEYGVINKEIIEIRKCKKESIKLKLNLNGYEHILQALGYFENQI